MDEGAAYREAVGELVRSLRSERGWTLRELSARSGVSVPYLSEIERGRKEPSGAILAQLARVFEFLLPELLTRVAGEFERRGALPPPRDPEREPLRRALDELSDDEAGEVANFVAYLRWRRTRPEGPEQR
ncbi:MAG TPA: helix-turn-helix transcriptional regulator [Thermomicrobiaceae bacterium]|nr:helix-turn-helix transcriptional regulator [Thermomicrobiaceae bacterium]